LEELGQLLQSLNKSATSLPQDARETWKGKIRNALSEQRMLLSSLKETCRRRDKKREDDEAKRALLERRYEDDTVMLDHNYQMNSSLNNSKAMVTSYIQVGRGLLTEFRRQRALLDGVHQALVGAGNTMGLSRSMMSIIERREFVDRLLAFSGMALISLILLAIWWYR